MNAVTVTTHANIALIKYWGKREPVLHLPTKSSLSVGLDALTTTTILRSAPFPLRPGGYGGQVGLVATDGRQPNSPMPTDQVFINGAPAPENIAQPIIDFLKLVRNPALTITTTNNFPTAAGLASSASGFAALALGLNRLFNLGLSPAQLSQLARRGSGSACRSLYGGFVIWHHGQHPDGHDSVAEQLWPATHWPAFRIIVVIVSTTPKAISSRVAMQRSVDTSPYYPQWLEESAHHLEQMHQALAHQDFATVGQLAEDDCLGMHKTMHTSNPPINFWSPTTMAIMQAVTDLRTRENVPCYFTIDAGPNVKILCQENDVSAILAHVSKITGVMSCITSKVAEEPSTTPNGV